MDYAVDCTVHQRSAGRTWETWENSDLGTGTGPAGVVPTRLAGLLRPLAATR